MNLIVSNIKFLRKKLGFTQQAFADTLGIKRSQLGSFEEGRATIKRDMLELMAEAFNVDVETFGTKDVSKLFDIPVYNGPKKLSTTNTNTNSDLVSPSKISNTTIPTESSANVESPLVGAELIGKPSDLFADIPAQVQPPIIPAIETVVKTEPAESTEKKLVAKPLATKKTDVSNANPIITEGRTQNTIVEESEAKKTTSTITKESIDSFASGELIRNIVFISNKEGETLVSMVDNQLWFNYPHILTDVKALAALPVMGVPFEKNNEIFRAFQLPDDFQNLSKNSWLITKFLRNWFTLVKGSYYLFSTNEELSVGQLLRTNFNEGQITLLTDLGEQTFQLSQLLEIWSVEHLYQIGMPKQTMPIQKIMDSLAQLQAEVQALKNG